jgi:hypothetical protein
MDDPAHTVGIPRTGVIGLIVIALVREQPVLSVYDIVTSPSDTPATLPVDPTVATVISLLLQVPPVVEFDRLTEAFAQITADPPIVAGRAFMVTIDVALHEP